jgi:organic hydroperoxide reductase OsmC/OhrA
LDGEAPIEVPERWTPEHLLLAALARCTLKSLAFHAGGALTGSSATMSSLVTRRESDGRYAVAEIELELDVRLDPEPEAEALAPLLMKAERDCFVGNSMTVRPRYAWRVNGHPATATA